MLESIILWWKRFWIKWGMRKEIKQLKAKETKAKKITVEFNGKSLYPHTTIWYQ